MRKIFKLFLVLFICLCLINTNDKHTKAEDGTTLYFRQGGDGNWGLFTDPSNDTAYSGQLEYWEVATSTLTLKSGFNYNATASTAINFAANSTLIIDSNPSNPVIISNTNATTTPAIYAQGNLTIKTKLTTETKDRPTLNIQALHSNYGETSAAIACNGDLVISGDKSGKYTGPIVNVEGNTNSGEESPAINAGSLVKVTGAIALDDHSELNARNNGNTFAVECKLNDTQATVMLNNGSVIKTYSYGNDQGGIKINGVDGSDNPTDLSTTLNNTYFTNTRNKYDRSCTEVFFGYDDTNKYNYIDGAYFEETPVSQELSEIRPIDNITSGNSLELTYDSDSNEWMLAYWDGSSQDIEIPGKGITWDIEEDEEGNIKLTLDNFTIVTNQACCFGIDDANKPLNGKLIINIKGDVNFFSKYNGNDSVYGLDFYHHSGDFKSIEFVGDGYDEETMTPLSSLDVYTGQTSKVDADLDATTMAMYSDNKASITFKNLSAYFIAKTNTNNVYPGVSAALVAHGCPKLTLDNAWVSLFTGTFKEITNPVTGNYYYNIGILNAGKDNAFTIDVVGKESILLLFSGMTTLFTSKNIFRTDNVIHYVDVLTDPDEPEEVSGHYGLYSWDLSSEDDTLTFYTFLIPNKIKEVKKTYIPCYYLGITSEKKPNPSPSPGKDESCEKVIGPTWHWNNDKGICEEVGVVGTSTR